MINEYWIQLHNFALWNGIACGMQAAILVAIMEWLEKQAKKGKYGW